MIYVILFNLLSKIKKEVMYKILVFYLLNTLNG